MSLLDDVSIVVTPNGYKAGELYAVVPVPTEGSEKVTNGDFATDSDWSKGTGWTISGGTANCDGTQSGNTDLSQNITTDTGKQYKITYTVSNYSAGSIFIRLNSGNVTSTKSSNGTFTEVLSGASGTQFILRANLDFNGSIDNVSVKEYTSADMDVTRNTAATRVDENGLVNYAEIVTGSDIVTDGDFPDGSTAWALNGWTISGNTANGNGLTANMIQTISGSTNKTYSLTFTISNYVSGSVTPAFVGFKDDSLNYSSNGTFTEVISSASDTRFVFYGASFNGSIDNVSVKEVTRDNVPRIDYTGGGCPHILAEPQRTNLVTYSEDFTSWNQIQNITLTANSTTSPSGDSDGTKFLSTSSGAKVRANFSAVSGTTYTLSLYCKNIDATLIKLLCYDGVNSFSNQFQSEVNTSTWTRISFTFTAANTGFGQIQIARDLPNGESAYFWGAQLEESYATSYIPTSGSTVTRNQDIFTRDGIGSLINSTEGVLFVEMAALSDDSDSKRITISDGTLTNRITISIASNIISGFINVNNVTQYTFYESGITTTDFNKIAIKYKVNDFAIWINGVEYDVDTSGVTFSADTLNTLNFSNATNLSNFFNGKVKQLQVYDTALTDEQLEALTS